MKNSSSYYSEIGGRKNNEDAAQIVEAGGTTLAVVADGLGGYVNGEIASHIAIRTITAELSQRKVSHHALKAAIDAANAQIIKEQETGGGMKSTVAVLWMNSSGALAANVGDTRIYQFRDGQIVYQSRDHTLLQLEVISGELKQQDVRKNPDRNCLLRALGAGEEVKADIVELSVRPGDAFLLCTDGFWDNILEEEMVETLSDASLASDWLRSMRRIAERRMSADNDNHTAIAIRLGER